MTSADQTPHRYRPTASKYKGGAREMYVTYELQQKTRGGGEVVLPKVKRVYIAGEVDDWKAGRDLRKRSGKQVAGVKIDYRRSREAYDREAKQDSAGAPVKAIHVRRAKQHFTQVVELPEKARNIHFYPSADRLPEKYKASLQDIR